MTSINPTITAPIINGIKFGDNMQKVMAEALLKNAVVIGDIKYLEIPVEMLILEPLYQRVDRGHSKAIAAKWDRRKAGVLLVSYRNGVFYVIDGQHRKTGGELAGERSFTCQVYEGLTIAQEAYIFGSQMEDTRKLTAQERFNAMLVARRQQELDISNICQHYNIVILPMYPSERPVLKGLCAVEKAYHVYGIECLEFIFSTIKSAGWHMVKGAYSDLMISALRNIYANHRNNLDWVRTKIAVAIEHTDLDLVRAKALCAYIGRGNAAAVTALLERCISMGESVALAG